MTTLQIDHPMAGAPAAAPGAVTGGVAATLRLEAAAALAAALIAYHLLGGSWWLFAVLFLVPDLSMLGYLIDSRAGAIVYNIGHSYLTPAALALAGFIAHRDIACLLAAIWVAHIGFDRLLGFGLKYSWAFGATHLGGKARPASG